MLEDDKYMEKRKSGTRGDQEWMGGGLGVLF